MNAKTLRNIFLGSFMISLLAFALLSRAGGMVMTGGAGSEPSPTQDPSYLPENNPQPVEQASNSLAIFSSIAASATSLIGFLLTAVITWRKEQRESALADVERKKLEMELEKSRLELEKLRKSGAKKSPGKK